MLLRAVCIPGGTADPCHDPEGNGTRPSRPAQRRANWRAPRRRRYIPSECCDRARAGSTLAAPTRLSKAAVAGFFGRLGFCSCL